MTERKQTSKSRRRILNAFIELRSQKELEKITVVEICERADINKSTFYVYFHDVYDLSRQMQQEIIDRIAASLPDPDNVIKNTAQFTRDILMAYEANKQQIQTMFSGSQSSRLPMLVKAKILELIQQMHPEIEDSQRLRLILNYKIYGAYYAFLEDTDMNEMEKIEYISNLAGESSFNA